MNEGGNPLAWIGWVERDVRGAGFDDGEERNDDVGRPLQEHADAVVRFHPARAQMMRQLICLRVERVVGQLAAPRIARGNDGRSVGCASRFRFEELGESLVVWIRCGAATPLRADRRPFVVARQRQLRDRAIGI